ncbi:hypothetical protein NP493_155g04048 [Ridgeia piscesae]|uniref:Cilia- and flagella-associated protein 69 ARM repeats domain-containing protein n=1 Tax=Ridgeia piscesae TaxID=27915 RepID=A0AAD9P404_RIDPI|nr:hypothetical protein NP493_155g04048 [Ridgeia piscesae]
MATTMQATASNAIHRQGQARRLQPMDRETDRTAATNIPLVRHIITDDDMGLTEGLQLQPVNLKRVIKLLLDPHSCMLYDRHVHALLKVARHYKDGYLLKDLVSVFRILNVCADRVAQHAVYAQCMVALLKPCSLPFFQQKSSDEVAFEQIARESVSQLGYLMRVPNSHVRTQICETLIDFYSGPKHTVSLNELKATTLAYNKKIIESSDVAETLVKSLAFIINDMEMKLTVLGVLQRFSKHSSVNCDKMLQAEAASQLCIHMMDNDKSGLLLFRSTDILWNLLESGSKEKLAAQLSNNICIGNIRDAFIHQLTYGYSHYDRQLRNDLLVVASLIASCASEAPFVEIGFIKQLTLFATFQEVKNYHFLVKHLKLMPNHEDFELKKLLINILVILSHDSAVIPLLSEGRLLLALFSYVRANEKTSGPQEWTPAEMEELQLHAMAALCTLAPIMIDDYMMCQGSTRLLLLLEWCVGTDDFGGDGNSFYAVGGRGNKRAQMRHCLRLMKCMTATVDENVLQDFADQGAINQLTGILRLMQQRDMSSDEIDCAGILLMMQQTDSWCHYHLQELFEEEGVDVLVSYLKLDLSLLTSGLGHQLLLITAIDCVWCCVFGCYTTEDYFLENEGIFLLIDLLESCPKNMHTQVFGCLLDLAENPKTLPHLSTWRGKDDISAAHLFCEKWREEEDLMGVKRDVTGAIMDADKPLMGALQESEGVIPLPASMPSQAIVDVSENMRAKIYAMFGKIGFVDLPGLTTEDHVTLTIIEHYLDFKLGEVWTEVVSELEVQGVRPITPDHEALEAISRTIEDRSRHVQQVQTELLQAQRQHDLIDEQEYYAEIRENHRQTERMIDKFNDYVARTSNYGMLKAAKERQQLSIDASRVQTKQFPKSGKVHSLELNNLTTTVSATSSLSLKTSRTLY